MPDDLDVLRDLRADVPEMTDEAFDDGRAQLVAAMNPREKGVMPLPRRRPGQQPRRGRLLLPVAAAAAVVLGAGVAVVATDQTSTGQTPVTNQITAGQLAEKVSEIPQSPGHYLYIRSLEWRNGIKEPPLETQTWIPKDRDEKWLRTNAEGWEVWARRGEFGGPGERNWSNPSQDFLAALPRDPDRLHEILRQTFDRPIGAFDAVSQNLGPTVPADLRAALLRTLDRLSGLQVGSGATADGRAAVVLSTSGLDMIQQQLFLDPGTGLPIGRRPHSVPERASHFPAGKLPGDEVISYAVVDKVGQRPT